MEYEIVTPARTGAAVHAVSRGNPDKTLCGKNPTGWQWLSGPIQRVRVIAMSDVSCLVCKKLYKERSNQQPATSTRPRDGKE